MVVRVSLFILAFVFSVGQSLAFANEERALVRVGIFAASQVEPGAVAGAPQSFTVDLLMEIARRENWKLSFVRGTWEENLARLRKGGIDIGMSIARMEEREADLDFSHEDVLTMWGQVYVPRDSHIHTLMDLDGKTVAVLRNGVNGINFSKLCEGFGIDCRLAVAETHERVFELVASGEADAGVANNLQGNVLAFEYALRGTPIVFSPLRILFAVRKGANGNLIAAIDGYLAWWKQDGESPYHAAMSRWFGTKAITAAFIPRWVLMTGGGLLALALAWVIVLRFQVKTRTRDLEQSKHKANHCPLTNLPNRILCMDRLENALARARRNGTMAGVMFLDLDGFKAVNDSFGHEAGDVLLKEVAARISSCIREVDTVARHGGDEFIILLTDVKAREAISNVAEKVIESLSWPFRLGGKAASIGCSIGIALYPDHGQTPEELLRQADAAMYAVKTGGRNNYCLATPELLAVRSQSA